MQQINRLLQGKLSLYKGRFYFVLFLLIVGVILQALAPWPFKFLIDNVLENQPLGEYDFIASLYSLFATKVTVGAFLVFSFFLIKILLSLLSYMKSLVVNNTMRDVIYEFSKATFENLEKLSMGFYRNQAIGDFIYRLSYDVSALGEYIEQGILPILQSSLYIVVITIILLFIDTRLTLITLISLPLVIFSLSVVNSKLAKGSRKSEYWNSAIFSFIQQALTQLKIIQAYTKEEQELTTFNKQMTSLLASNQKTNVSTFLITLFVSIVVAVSYSGILWLGITDVFEGTLTAGEFIVFLFYLDSLPTHILAIIYAVSIIKASHVKISRIGEYFSPKYHIEDKGTQTNIPHNTITFQNVSVKGQEGDSILEDITLTIPENKITAVMGVSGSGKTTLLSLIPRLTQPALGTITLGNVPIEQYQLKTLRKHIAYVPQETLLFNRSIRDVIGFGKEHATREEITKAAKRAVADEFIEKLPGEYNFKIGEEGAYLSAGQRQRLMLAQAYVKDAKIVLLDEVFSSQDEKTRFAMLANFRQLTKGKTIVIISNEDDIISEADIVVVMHKGKILHVYTHEQLLEKRLLRKANFNQLLLGKLYE